MSEFQQAGKFLIFAGIFILILGGLFLFGDKIPFLGKLPGRYLYKEKKFYFLLSYSYINIIKSVNQLNNLSF